MLHIFSQVLELSLGLFDFIFLSVFGLACDNGNSFLCLEEWEREGTGYQVEVNNFAADDPTNKALTFDISPLLWGMLRRLV